MRDLFVNDVPPLPSDPMESARRGMRAPLRQRFYREATVGAERAEGFPVLLDERPVRTPVRRLLAAPTAPLAAAISDEWAGQGDRIDPYRMPLTRLANTIIDGVSAARQEVAGEIEQYLGSDLLFYRAEHPERLVALQARHWDPVLAWAHEVFGARFILSAGVVYVAQPEQAIAAARAAVPDDPWRLGAAHTVTTLTGSALLALALLRQRLSADEAWVAAHVDEDWNISQWGADELAQQRRALRREEMQAAATVLALLA